MNRFKNILCVLNHRSDLSESLAVKQALKLSQLNGATLTLMEVINIPQYTIKRYKDIVGVEDLLSALIKTRRKDIEDGLQSLDAAGLNVVIKVLSGRDFIEIVKAVINDGIDLVVKDVEQSAASFAGCDFHLMRKCPVPVWLIKSDQMDKASHLLAAIDLNMQDSEEGREINRLIMELAITLARLQSTRLSVLSCWSLYGEDALRYSGFLHINEQELSAVLQTEQASQEALFEQLLGEYEEESIDRYLVKGEPSTVIPDFVAEHAIQTVVMGTLGRSGIPGYLIGNTAETVLKLIDASVITVKPQGFISPIR